MEGQVEQVLVALRDVLGRELVGAYLHGSAVLGGLRPHSDVDVLAVSARPTTRDERRRLAVRLGEFSGRRARVPGRPVELTIVVAAAVRPWRAPGRLDFQYGGSGSATSSSAGTSSRGPRRPTPTSRS